MGKKGALINKGRGVSNHRRNKNHKETFDVYFKIYTHTHTHICKCTYIHTCIYTHYTYIHIIYLVLHPSIFITGLIMLPQEPHTFWHCQAWDSSLQVVSEGSSIYPKQYRILLDFFPQFEGQTVCEDSMYFGPRTWKNRAGTDLDTLSLRTISNSIWSAVNAALRSQSADLPSCKTGGP